MYRWFAIPRSFFSDSISTGDKALDHRQTLRELLVLIGEVDRRQRKGVPRPQDADAHICALLDVESLLVGQNFSFRQLEIDLTIDRPNIPPSVQSLLGRTWLTFEEIQALLLQRSLSGLDANQVEFLEQCRDRQEGLVEVFSLAKPNELGNCFRNNVSATEHLVAVDQATLALVSKLEASLAGQSSSGDKRRTLREQMVEAAAQRRSFPVQDQGHEVFTESLSQLICRQSHRLPAELPLIYRDGSVARPFPVYQVEARDSKQWSGAVELSFALISVRHTELDFVANQAWYRNALIGWTETTAESDEYCFDYSRQSIDLLCQSMGDRPFIVNMFHTGLEQAVVGFYRAVVCRWLERPSDSRFLVRPCYFRGGDHFQKGRLWPTAETNLGN